MNIYNNGINPSIVQKLQTKPANNVFQANEASKAPSFNDILTKTLDNTASESQSVEFSKHAQIRMNDRNIQFSSNQLERIEKGISQAREKGIKDSLLLVDNVALIVNVRNNMVVTAVDESQDKVFTNIDGAIVV